MLPVREPTPSASLMRARPFAYPYLRFAADKATDQAGTHLETSKAMRQLLVCGWRRATRGRCGLPYHALLLSTLELFTRWEGGFHQPCQSLSHHLSVQWCKWVRADPSLRKFENPRIRAERFVSERMCSSGLARWHRDYTCVQHLIATATVHPISLES